MKSYIIREIRADELPLLKTFLYEAIFQPDPENLLPFEVINNPDISVYIDNWGQKDDICLVCECDEKVVGAVWTRILAGEVKGYGNIDSETPEFAISLLKEFRREGIGTELMKAMLHKLKERGYKRTSLSVQKENYALKLYKAVGFEVVKEQDEDYIMVCKLK